MLPLTVGKKRTSSHKTAYEEVLLKFNGAKDRWLKLTSTGWKFIKVCKEKFQGECPEWLNNMSHEEIDQAAEDAIVKTHTFSLRMKKCRTKFAINNRLVNWTGYTNKTVIAHCAESGMPCFQFSKNGFKWYIKKIGKFHPNNRKVVVKIGRLSGKKYGKKACHRWLKVDKQQGSEFLQYCLDRRVKSAYWETHINMMSLIRPEYLPSPRISMSSTNSDDESISTLILEDAPPPSFDAPSFEPRAGSSDTTESTETGMRSRTVSKAGSEHEREVETTQLKKERCMSAPAPSSLTLPVVSKRSRSKSESNMQPLKPSATPLKPSFPRLTTSTTRSVSAASDSSSEDSIMTNALVNSLPVVPEGSLTKSNISVEETPPVPTNIAETQKLVNGGSTVGVTIAVDRRRLHSLNSLLEECRANGYAQ